MAGYDLRILHLSDLHAKCFEEDHSQRSKRNRRRKWRFELVFGEKWQRNLDEMTGDGKPVDIMCFTGDIADWGLSGEYAVAKKFLKETADRIGLPMDRMFLVPGNHDIQRKVHSEEWKKLRKAVLEVDSLRISEWMSGDDSPFGVDPAWRSAVLKRSATFWKWVSRDLGRPDLLPRASAHGYLGYHNVIRLSDQPFDIHVIGMDSAWLSGDNNDAGKLLVTEDQVGILTSDVNGKSLSGFRLALIHHPLEDLADGINVFRLLSDRCDLLLRGHQHTPILRTVSDPDSAFRELAAGCLYEGREEHKYANACQLIDVSLDKMGRPMAYRIRFRSWSPNGFWYDDGSLYKEAENGYLNWIIRSEADACEQKCTVSDKIIGEVRDAIAFHEATDDGMGAERYPEADIVLMGVSRTGNTTIAHELAKIGYKAANFPLIPEQKLPESLWQVDPRRVFYLESPEAVLLQRRIDRQKNYPSGYRSSYTDILGISRELGHAKSVWESVPEWEKISQNGLEINEIVREIIDRLPG